MSLTERYAYYLAIFEKVAHEQVELSLRIGDLGVLKSFDLREDARGVWAEVVIDVRDAEGRTYERGVRIIDAALHPPEDPPHFAATMFATNVVPEEWDIPRLRQYGIEGG